MSAPPTLLIATSNPGKRREFARLLPSGLRLVTLDEVGVEMPPEVGASFADIARVKALHAASATGLLTLADDSGLEVDALDGAPGVRSARFAGEPAEDERNRFALLLALRDVPPERRTARFRCVAVLARAGTIVAEAEGSCEGKIVETPSGTLGFGYDPIFAVANGQTLAELPPDEKDRVSHRGAAMARVVPRLLVELGLAPGKDAAP